MPPPYDVPRVSVSSAAPGAADVDLIIIPVAQDHTASAIGAYDAVFGGDLSSALDRGEFSAKPCEVFVPRTPASDWRAARVIFIGGGPRTEIHAERMRRMAATAAQAARQACQGGRSESSPSAAAVPHRACTVASS